MAYIPITGFGTAPPPPDRKKAARRDISRPLACIRRYRGNFISFLALWESYALLTTKVGITEKELFSGTSAPSAPTTYMLLLP